MLGGLLRVGRRWLRRHLIGGALVGCREIEHVAVPAFIAFTRRGQFSRLSVGRRSYRRSPRKLPLISKVLA